MKESKKMFKSIGYLGIALCVSCCILPLVGMVSVGTFAIMAKYFEWAGIMALMFSIVFFGICFFKSRKVPSCNIDCGCKTKEQHNVAGKNV
jgi:hypothetical protein